MIKIKNGYGEVKMDAFIIPNNAAVSKDYILAGGRFGELHEKLARLNMYPYDIEKDKLVQMWFVEIGEEGDDDLCDNMDCHDFTLKDESGEVYWARLGVGHLPESILNDKKEGDELQIDIPIRANKIGHGIKNGTEIPITLKATIRLKQLEYRYARFGQFQDALRYVLS